MGWTPADISTAIWFDASDENTLTLSGSDVIQWDDKSGNNRYVDDQSDISKRPTYADDQISNDGSAKYLTGTISGVGDGAQNEYTVFIVATPDKSSNGGHAEGNTGTAFYSSDGNDNCIPFVITGNTGDVGGPVAPIFSITTNYIAMTETRNSLAPYLVCRSHTIGSNRMMVMYKRKTDKSIQTSINGEDPVAGTAGQVTNLTWTGHKAPALYTTSSFWNGDLNEVILLFDGDISTETRQKIEGYLAHKWDISDDLPSDHPYKNYGYFSGTVYEELSTVSGVAVYVYRRDNGAYAGGTTSSGDGGFYVEVPYSGDHFIVALDKDGGIQYNLARLDKMTPAELLN